MIFRVLRTLASLLTRFAIFFPVSPGSESVISKLAEGALIKLRIGEAKGGTHVSCACRESFIWPLFTKGMMLPVSRFGELEKGAKTMIYVDCEPSHECDFY